MTETIILQPEKAKAVSRAAEWLLNSGLQDREQNKSRFGGVNAWFDLQTHTYSFIYGEITGYAINSFLFFYALTEKSQFLEAAKNAAEWLLQNTYPESGLIRNRVNQEGFNVRYFDVWVFTFDQWIMIYSLACLYKETKELRYLEKSASMARFLLENTTRADGSFFPIWNVDSRKPEATDDKWSRQSGSFHAKALMALEKLNVVTGDRFFIEAGTRLAEWALKQQQPDGRFITQTSNGSTHLHPHLYTLEGLLSWGISQGDERCLESARKGFQWIFEHSTPDGKILSFYENQKFIPFMRTDILAQSLRVGAILSTMNKKISAEDLEPVAKRLLSFQILEGSQKGGFLYGQEQDGTILYHVNSWVTMFASQALALQEDPHVTRQICLDFFV